MNPTPRFDPDLAFEIVYSHSGGKWDFEAAKPTFQSQFLRYVESIPNALMQVARSRLEEVPDGQGGRLPDVHFGLTSGQSINCYATRFNDRYFVGMGAMVPIALLEVSAFFFSQPDFYPEIGNPEEGPLLAMDGVESLPMFQIADNRFAARVRRDLSERAAGALSRSLALVRGSAGHHDVETGRPLSASEYCAQFDTLIDLLLPVCPVRREHTRYLASVLAHFFWFHEIAHVSQGHLRSLQGGRKELLTLYEFDEGRSQSARSRNKNSHLRLDQATSLAMEFDADVEAIILSLGIILLDIDIESDEFPYVDKYERVGLFSLILVLVFQILARREAMMWQGGPRTHPPADLRLTNMLMHLVRLSSADERLIEAIRKGLGNARRLARTRYSFLRGVLDNSQSYDEELLAINQHRTHLVSGFDAYGYGNLRVLITSVLDDLKAMDIMQLGPEPTWWQKEE